MGVRWMRARLSFLSFTPRGGLAAARSRLRRTRLRSRRAPARQASARGKFHAGQRPASSSSSADARSLNRESRVPLFVMSDIESYRFTAFASLASQLNSSSRSSPPLERKCGEHGRPPEKKTERCRAEERAARSMAGDNAIGLLIFVEEFTHGQRRKRLEVEPPCRRGSNPYKRRCASRNNADTRRGRAVHNSGGPRG